MSIFQLVYICEGLFCETSMQATKIQKILHFFKYYVVFYIKILCSIFVTNGNAGRCGCVCCDELLSQVESAAVFHPKKLSRHLFTDEDCPKRSAVAKKNSQTKIFFVYLQV